MARLLGLIAAVLVVVPIALMIIRLFYTSGRINLSSFPEAVSQPGIGLVMVNTVVAVSAGALFALAIGSLLAWINERTDGRMGWASDIIPVIPLLIPGIVLSIGWSFLLAPVAGFINIILRAVLASIGIEITQGPFNIYSWPGLIWVYTLYFVPFVYLPMAAALRNLDSSYEEASRVSGAGPWKTFVNVVLPAIRPAIGGSLLMVVVIGVALFSVPAVIGLRARIEVLPVRIVQLMTAFPPRENVALVLGTVILIVVAGVWSLQRKLIALGRHGTINSRTLRNTGVRLGAWRPAVRLLMIVYLLTTTILPFAALIIVSMQPFWSPRIVISVFSFDQFRELLQQTYLRRSIVNSVTLSITGAIAALFIAAIISYWRQQENGFLSQIADGILKLPASVSNILIGVGFILAFGGWPLQLGGSFTILLLAYISIHLPQASFLAESALTQVDRQLSEASFMAGAGLVRTLFAVVLPLMKQGIIAAWAVLFVTMLGDLTVSAVLAGTRTPVIGFVMLELWQGGTYPAVAAMGVIVSSVSGVFVGGVFLLNRRKSG